MDKYDEEMLDQSTAGMVSWQQAASYARSLVAASESRAAELERRVKLLDSHISQDQADLERVGAERDALARSCREMWEAIEAALKEPLFDWRIERMVSMIRILKAAIPPASSVPLDAQPEAGKERRARGS